jgi:RimJ/RimL family protein N-acetyltransferase
MFENMLERCAMCIVPETQREIVFDEEDCVGRADKMRLKRGLIKVLKKKRRVFIEGERIYLREIKLSDANKNYRNWMNDPEINQYLESRFEGWSVGKLKRYISDIKKNPDNVFLAIVSRDRNKHIGNIKIGPINQSHRYADVGVIIGEKSFWGKGIAAEAIKLVVDYAFNSLDLHKLTAGAYRCNSRSIKAFQKAGFSIEGVRKKHCLCNGNYVDSVLLGIVRR